MKKKLIYTLILVVLFVGFFGVYYFNKDKNYKQEHFDESVDDNFTSNIIKKSFKKENYLISPYSIEVALNMLKSGAQGDTQKEIDKVVNTRNLNIKNNNVKIANALFIKSMYSSVVESKFINLLKNNYNSELLYDEFKNPDVINGWVSKSTNGMIEKILDNIDPSFVLGLANAVAIDVKWKNPFECDDTISKKFIKSNGIRMNVEMMHQSYSSDAKYLIDDELKGIILPYKENLEFIAILPNDNLENYIKKLDINILEEKINTKFEKVNSKKRLDLLLPRFSYNYNIKDFKNILISMGIKLIFDSEKANFNSIITKENINKLGIDNIYVSDAIHKTYIDLNEEGAKAAAVTYFGVRAEGVMINDYEEVKIEFNKPFIYMIRDTESKEVLFFGTVYEPNEWKGSTCQNLEN